MAAQSTIKFKKGQLIILEGEMGDNAYKILSGEVMVCKRKSEKHKDHWVPLATLGPGEKFGEMYLFDSRRSRSATVIAISPDVELEICPQEDLMTIMEKTSPLMKKLLHGLSSHLLQTSGDYTTLYTEVQKKSMPHCDVAAATQGVETLQVKSSGEAIKLEDVPPSQSH